MNAGNEETGALGSTNHRATNEPSLATRLGHSVGVASALRNTAQSSTSYRLETSFEPNDGGGRWGKSWNLHADLGSCGVRTARQALSDVRRRFECEEKNGFRLVRVITRTEVVLS